MAIEEIDDEDFQAAAPSLESPFGLYSAQDIGEWSMLAPEVGQVIECCLPGSFAMEAGVWASFLVAGKEVDRMGGLVLEVKSLGSAKEAVTTRLSSIFNRKTNYIHACAGQGECHVKSPDEVAFHLTELGLWPAEGYNRWYIGAGGKKMLANRNNLKVLAEGREKDSGDKGGSAKGLGQPLKEKPSAAKVKNPKEAGEKDRGKSPAQGPDYQALRRRLSEVKARHTSGPDLPGGEAEENYGDGRSRGSGLGFAAAPSLTDGRRMPSIMGDLQSMQKAPQGSGSPYFPEMSAASNPVWANLRGGKKDVEGRLAMNAALAAGGGPGGGDPGDKKKKSSKKDKKKKKKKSKKDAKKKKKKKKKKGDGGSGPSSSSSGSGGGSSSSGSDSDGSESESKDYLPPLKRKSEERPGAVFQLLLAKIEEHLAAIGEGGAALSQNFGGTRVLTYFNSLIKGGINPVGRDGRELYLLAVSLDQLRMGQLAQLGDGLAARFLALHQASLDGSWQAARNLEIHTPELVSAAGAQITLAARKHTKLLEKVKGQQRDGGQQQWKGGWNGGWFQQEKGWQDGKGKGKKGNGKQKGKDDPWKKGKGKHQHSNAAWEKAPEGKTKEAEAAS